MFPSLNWSYASGPSAQTRDGLGLGIRNGCVLIGILWLLSGALVSATADPYLGLTTQTNATFALHGKPFRGIGVNYYDAFVRTLHAKPRYDFEDGFAQLEKLPIPFARFSAGGYWPVEWGLYRTNRAEYFARLDAVVASAERHRIGLIPSLFWYAPTIPDLVGEPVTAWGKPESRTIAFMRTYTREIVTRYRDRKVIWAWEFGNEYNLPADLPNAAEHRPAVVPALGTATQRSQLDDLAHLDFRFALQTFATEVRRLDATRAIFSGNAFPRPSAWHQAHERTWGKDTPAQWNEMLTADNPSPIDTLTGRLYSESDRAAIDLALDVARRTGKPLFIGEFGVASQPKPGDANSLNSVVEELDRRGVQLAALWVFDFSEQDLDWNVRLDNSRRTQLEAIVDLNQRWAKPRR